MADKPVTREEKYLAYLTGDYTGEIPKPITRKEKYLYELCLKGMGGEISPEEIKAAVNEYLEKNPVKPGATTEQAQQIEQNKTDVASLKEETGSLKEDLAHVISKTDGSFTSDDLSVFTTIEDGKYTKGGSPMPLANYKMMYFKATKDFHFWCDENCTDSTQFYICVFRNDTISTANNVNKYLINDTSTPLPTVGNKGFCESGNLFVVSILTPNTSPKYFRIETDYIDGEVKLKDSLGLPATGRQEVAI